MCSVTSVFSSGKGFGLGCRVDGKWKEVSTREESVCESDDCNRREKGGGREASHGEMRK